MDIIVVTTATSPQRYRLEYNLTGEWELEQGFPSCNAAESYARKHLPSNEWRVFDVHVGEVVSYQSAIAGFCGDLKKELKRFDNTAKWRNHFEQARSRPRPKKKIKTVIREVINWLKEGF